MVSHPPEEPDAGTGLPSPLPFEETHSHAGSAASGDVVAPRETASFRPDSGPTDLTASGGPPNTPVAASGADRPPPVLPGYEILGELGRGAMGVVYKARQAGLNRVVAIKMILAGSHASRAVVGRFLAEAKAVARFQHPNLVQIYEVSEIGGLPYFSLEYVEGGTLSNKIAREPQPPREAAATVEQLARAMQYAHERGIVHRDLKPSNVLVTADGAPKITDFGLAKSLEGNTGETQTGQVLGTPSYMAPEQASGDVSRVGPPADIYALGGILYDLLTGRPPFVGSSVLDTLEMVRNRPPVPPGQLTGKLPRDVETICLKCLAKDPAKRYATADDLADDLRRFLDGRAILARPASRAERAWRWARRNPAGALAVFMALALLVVPSVLSWELFVAKDREEAKRREAEDERDKKEKARLAEEEAKNEAIAARLIAVQRRKEAEDAREVTTQQRRLAIDTVRDVLQKVDELMKNDARLASVRIEIIRRMIADVDQIRDHALRNPLEDRTEAMAFARLGEIYFRGNRVEDSQVWFAKAHASLAKVAADAPDDPNAMRNLAAISHQFADAEWRLGNGNRARELHLAGLDLRRKRLELLRKSDKAPEMDTLGAQSDVAESLNLVAFTELRLGDAVSAIEHYHAAEKMFADLPPPSGMRVDFRRLRCEIKVRLGEAFSRLGKLDEADKLYRESLAERETLQRTVIRPPALTRLLRTDIGQSHMFIGDFLLFFRKDQAAAKAEYAACLDIFMDVLREEPDSLDARQRVAAAQYRVGMTTTDPEQAKKAHSESLKIRQELAIIDRRDAQSGVELALSLARTGKAEEAERLVESLLRQAGTDRQVLFQVACALSVVSGTTADRKTAERCRNQSFQVLRDLIAAGWKDRGGIEADPDFDAIRGDARYAELLKAFSRR